MANCAFEQYNEYYFIFCTINIIMVNGKWAAFI